jgi:hypothetical protein
MDFSVYDGIKEYTLGEIAKLWCEMDIYVPVQSPEQLAQAKSILRMITDAMNNKELKWRLQTGEITDERRQINDEIIPQGREKALLVSLLIQKDNLLEWAKNNGYKPGFLFPKPDREEKSTNDIEDDGKPRIYNPRSELGISMLEIGVAYAKDLGGSKIVRDSMVRKLEKKGVKFNKETSRYEIIDPDNIDGRLAESERAFSKKLTRVRRHIDYMYRKK